MTYEVFSMTDRKKCMKYSETASFDKCNFNQLEQFFAEEIGCSVPFLYSTVSVCKNESLIQKVTGDWYRPFTTFARGFIPGHLSL